jgi:hypothetical protein
MLKKALALVAGSSLALAGFAGTDAAYAGGHHSYSHHGYHHHGGQAFGYAALGAGVGYLIFKAGQHSSPSAYDRGYYDGQRDSYYYYRPSVPQVIVIPQSAEAQSYAPSAGGVAPTADGAFDFSQCQETRPYETTIYVEGQPQPATGTACLTQDGVWVAGPMSFGR